VEAAAHAPPLPASLGTLVALQHCPNGRIVGRYTLQKVMLLALLFTAGTTSALADQKQHSGQISCEVVREYVARVGLVRARAIAFAHGMTRAQEREARRCLSE
jgi:hypothetical protein